MYFQQTNARNVYVYYAQIFMILQGRRKGGEFIFLKGGGCWTRFDLKWKYFSMCPIIFYFNLINYIIVTRLIAL